MSDYDNYSSDDNSSDEIGLPKTPGAPLNTNHSDSEESQQNDRSDSEQSESEDDKQSEQNNDDSSDKKSSSNDSEEEKSSDSASEDDSDDNELDQNNHLNENKDNKKADTANDRKRPNSSSDSDDESRVSKKRKSIIDSSDESHEEDEVPKPEDLFGDVDDDEDDENSNSKKDTTDKNEINKKRNGNIDDEDEDEGENNRNNTIESNMNEIFGDNEDDQENMDEEDAQMPETRIEVEIPRITADLGENIHFVKLPNFLSIDTHPYDPQWYEDEIDEDEVHDDEGRARLKLKVENTIRWRNVPSEDGQTNKESNARVVEWSDGSMSLHLGDEIFDIQTLNLLPGENNHLFIRQGTGLQGQSVFKTKLTFRPFSTESFTHRKLTLSLADRSQKTQKICVLPNVGKDPEAHRSEMIKKEEVKLKASIRKENKPRRIKDRAYTRGISNSYLEHEDEDDESISISKIKNQYKRGTNYSNAQYSDYEDENENDDSDLDIFEKKKSSEKRKIVESDED